LIPSPIVKVLSTIRKHGVRALLMGGQACVFYGAAEFSRDLDLLILADPENLENLRIALADLEAEQIAVPPFDAAWLAKGHALHFRCHRQDVAGLRIDIMSRYREGSNFEELWNRRTVIEVEGEPVQILAIEDLVNAKKTQRDKDWPMLSRLVEGSYFACRDADEHPAPELVEFWLRELRTPDLLIEVAGKYRGAARSLAASRRAVASALTNDTEKVAEAIADEEREERRKDREYWQPLKAELERLRHRRSNQKL
jgi:hypothetical protein